MTDTIFSKIIKREIPADFIYEDQWCVALNDIAPQAPVHILVIPKKPLAMLNDATHSDQSLLGHLLLVAAKLAREKGVADHYRILINNGEGAGQTVFHLHLHLLGNDTFTEQDLGRH